MSDATAISWTDSTFNPWFGCTKVGPGCDHCYAETLMATRYKKVEWGAGKPRVRTSAANWRKPVQWNAQEFVECASTSAMRDTGCGWRGELREFQQVDPSGFAHTMCPARPPDAPRLARLDWVIAGGESGPKARPMHPDWARSLRDQCAGAGVPFHFKQHGEWWPYLNEDHFTDCGAEKPSHAHAWIDLDTGDRGECWIIDDDGLWSNWTGSPRRIDGKLHPSVAVVGRIGKKAAGRLLDGVEHNGFPA